MTGSHQPKITGLNVSAILLPMLEPHRTASGVVSESPLVLTELHTDAGITGRSIVFTYTPIALKPLADLISNMSALIENQPLAPTQLEAQLSARFRLLGTQGLIGMALAAIDMAMWDAHTRVHQTNLVQLLGGTAKAVPVYGGIGYDGEHGSAASAETWVKRGFRGVKAKIGYPDVSEDLKVIRAIRDTVGPDVDVMVDYNQCLSPIEAIERVKHLNDAGLTWIEEPTLAHDYSGHAAIRDQSDTPIQSGENWWGTQDLQHALDNNASDFVMLDVMKVGGVSGWLRGAAMAASKNIPVSSHLWPEISSQLLSVTPTAHWVEYCDWWNSVLAEPLQVENGYSTLSDSIGTGMDWLDDIAEQYRI